ncbi:MAG: protease SohB [Pseudobdellovibrionaceae bacterium]
MDQVGPELLIFAGKVFLFVLGFGSIALIVAAAASRSQHKGELQIDLLDDKYKDFQQSLKSILLNKKEFKAELKKQKKQQKENADEASSRRIFVLNFKGDIEAKATDQLREEISAVLTVAQPEDEVVVKVESPGGVVHGYGLAAAQLLRIREKNIPLTVSVDKVAASGGYLMACVAHKILAAPFAIVGSIGVVAEFPNFSRLLKKNEVDYKEYTAGESKRTVGVLSEITPAKEDKFKQELELTHVLFKDFVKAYRPQLEIEKIATGEHWYGKTALDLKLVDVIQTSDDYIQNKIFAGEKTGKHSEAYQVVEVHLEKKKAFKDKISEMISLSVEQATSKILEKLQGKRWL